MYCTNDRTGKNYDNTCNLRTVKEGTKLMNSTGCPVITCFDADYENFYSKCIDKTNNDLEGEFTAIQFSGYYNTHAIEIDLGTVLS